MNDVEAVEKLKEARAKLLKEIRKVIIGQDEVINQILITLLAQGHCIIVGVPGLAKTLIINTLADALSLSFNRIQFTPDLMPADITGTDIIEEDIKTGKRKFRFVRGPIFANVILADEINRTPPKTQSALLEAMQEYKVTASGRTYELEKPFFVLATQNPIEQEGTYPLPEAQIDRFMFEVGIYYPSQKEEEKIVETTTSAYMPEIKKVLSSRDILELQALVRRVPVSDDLISQVVRFVSLTRPGSDSSCPKYIKDFIAWGASPRASQYLILGAKALSVLNGNYTPSIDDVRELAIPVLKHRLITNFHAEAEGITTLEIIKKLLKEI
ncbi:AAA family ATPase [candidate division WOR-3 bacterium]|nr:AAA family ATPase [candidate division WOR-3 bacterium]